MSIQSNFSHIIQVKCQLLEVKNKRERNFSNAYIILNKEIFLRKKINETDIFFKNGKGYICTI